MKIEFSVKNILITAASSLATAAIIAAPTMAWNAVANFDRRLTTMEDNAALRDDVTRNSQSLSSLKLRIAYLEDATDNSDFSEWLSENMMAPAAAAPVEGQD